MRISLILAHPDEESFNHALAGSVRDALEAEGHEVTLHDLHGERFDPRMTREEVRTHRSQDASVEAHVAEIVAADGLVFVHPVWFDAPPAILKGWVERVLREGDAFERGVDGGFVGRLQAEAALLVTTQNAPRGEGVDAVDHFWSEFVLPAMGVREVERVTLTPVVASDETQRRAWLDEVATTARRRFPAVT